MTSTNFRNCFGRAQRLYPPVQECYKYTSSGHPRINRMYMLGAIRRSRDSICQKKEKVSLVVLILYPIYKFFLWKNEFKFMRLQHQCILHNRMSIARNQTNASCSYVANKFIQRGKPMPSLCLPLILLPVIRYRIYTEPYLILSSAR